MIMEGTVILRVRFDISHIPSIPIAPNFQRTGKFNT